MVENKFLTVCRLFPIKKIDKIASRQPTPEPAAGPAAEPTRKEATGPTPKPVTEATPIKHKKPKLKLRQDFMNEIIAYKKDINNKILLNYFKYQNPLF